MTGPMLQRDELASVLEASLALTDMADSLGPQWLQRAHELLETLKNSPPDAAIFNQISLIAESGNAAIQSRVAELRHEQDTLIGMISKNIEVADRLDQGLQVDLHQSLEAWQSFNIARKLIARQGDMLLQLVDRTHVEQLVAKNLKEILKSPTTGALTQAMRSLISEASILIESFEHQNQQIMNVVEAVYARLNQLPGFTLTLPQLSGLENCRLDLQQLEVKVVEFCRRPINLMTDKTSLAKKFGVEVVQPLRELFTQLEAETDWWLNELSVPVQSQIQVKKMTLERREEDISMIRGQIATLKARIEETEVAFAKLHEQKAAIDRISVLAQTPPFANPA